MLTPTQRRKARLDKWLAAAPPEQLQEYARRCRESRLKAYQNNKDARRKYAREYAQRKRDADKGAVNDYKREKYHQENPLERAKRQVASYKVKLRKDFGMTLQQYDEMLREQNALCAICKKPEFRLSTKARSVMRLSVDHDHTTGAVRGLLCGSCNRGLGLFGDNADTILSATEYLKHHATKNIPNCGNRSLERGTE